MAEVGSLLVDGATEVEVANDKTGAEVEVGLDDLKDLSIGLDTGAVGVHVEGHGVSNTNGIGDLDEGTTAELGSDEGLGDPAGSIGSGAIDLAGVLAREGSTTVGAPTTVGVDDDLTTSGTGITHGATNDEATRGVKMEDNLVIKVLGGDDGLDDLLEEDLADGLVVNTLSVLGGDDDGVDALGDHGAIVILVLDGDLGLGVRAQPGDLTRVAGNGEALNELGGEDVSEGHHLGGLVGGIAEHVALVTSTNVLVLAADVNTTGNVGRLLLEADHDVAGLVVEALGGVVEANALDGITDDLLVVGVALGGDLTEDHDHTGLGGGL